MMQKLKGINQNELYFFGGLSFIINYYWSFLIIVLIKKKKLCPKFLSFKSEECSIYYQHWPSITMSFNRLRTAISIKSQLFSRLFNFIPLGGLNFSQCLQINLYHTFLPLKKKKKRVCSKYTLGANNLILIIIIISFTIIKKMIIIIDQVGIYNRPHV